MKSFQAHSDGQVLVPDEPVDLPRGTKYRVSVEPVEGEPAEVEPADDESAKGFPLLDMALEIASKMKGNYPRDLARNHDHYLHGRPKR